MRPIYMILLVLCFGFLSRGAAGAAPVELEFWHSMTGEKGHLLENLINEFNGIESNRGRVSVKLTYMGTYNDAITKIRTAAMAKKVPHVVQVYDVGTRLLVESGQVVALEDLVGGDKSFGLDQLLPQVSSYYRVNGKLFSLPFSTSNPIVYFNKDWFAKSGVKEVPQSFEEFLSIGAKLSDSKKSMTAVTWPLNSWFFEQFVARQGADLIDGENGRASIPNHVNYASEAGVRYVEWLASLNKAGVFANVGRDWDPPVQNFLAGKSAMLITSTSDVFVITDKSTFKVGTAPIPKPQNIDAAKGGTIVGGNSLWIMKDKPVEQQRLACEFLKFLASPKIQRQWHMATGYFPVRKDVIESLEKEGFYAKYPNAKTAIDQLRASAEVSATRGALMGIFPEAREHIESAIEEVLGGKASAKAALSAAAERSDRALQRYNKMAANRK